MVYRTIRAKSLHSLWLMSSPKVSRLGARDTPDFFEPLLTQNFSISITSASATLLPLALLRTAIYKLLLSSVGLAIIPCMKTVYYHYSDSISLSLTVLSHYEFFHPSERKWCILWWTAPTHLQGLDCVQRMAPSASVASATALSGSWSICLSELMGRPPAGGPVYQCGKIYLISKAKMSTQFLPPLPDRG